MGDDTRCPDDTKPPSKSRYSHNRNISSRTASAVCVADETEACSLLPQLGFINPPSSAKSPSTHVCSERTAKLRQKVFPSATDAQWNDWRWQVGNAFTSLKQLRQIIVPTAEEIEANRQGASLPVRITPYYASLFYDREPTHPLRKAMVPQVFEKMVSAGEARDPLNEGEQSPLPGLVHRYPDRVLFLSTTACSCYCRYCTRSRIVGHAHGPEAINRETWVKGFEYIAAHPEIRDVLISGGDPLMLDDDSLQFILSRIRRIPHVEIIRIGTKTPAVLPQRITPQLTRILKKYGPLYMSIHFTHPDELTPETLQACGRLADSGIVLGSQTVLLAGINDNSVTMKALCQGLLRARVRPYYLYQCDPILGSSHFRTPVKKGLEIIQALRGHTTGYAVPTYVIDAPGGGGKIPLGPETVAGYDGLDIVLNSYDGGQYRYPDTKGLAAGCGA